MSKRKAILLVGLWTLVFFRLHVLELEVGDLPNAHKNLHQQLHPQPAIVFITWSPSSSGKSDVAGPNTLCYAVAAAALTHNSTAVHVLAENYTQASACNHAWNVRVWNLSEFQDTEPEVKFSSVYKNSTVNPHWFFELQCFERFFWLLNFMHKQLVSRALFLDSDVVLTQNLFDRGLPVASTFWARSPPSTFWSYWSLDALTDFCTFMTEFYKGPLEDVAKRLHRWGKFKIEPPDWWPLQELEARHFADMFMQEAFVHGRPDLLAGLDNFTLHDVRALKPDFTNFKKLTWESVDGVNIPSLEGERIDGVHFQGGTKYLIPKFFHTVWSYVQAEAFRDTRESFEILPLPDDLLNLPLRMDLLGLEVGPQRTCPGKPDTAVACCQAACQELPVNCEFWSLRLQDGLCRLRRNYTGQFKASGPGLSVGVVRSGFREARGLTVEAVRFLLPPVKRDLKRLQRELRKPCPEMHFRPAGNSSGWRNASRMGAWVDWALQQPRGQVQNFPEHGVLLSTKTCLNQTGVTKAGQNVGLAGLEAEQAGHSWYRLTGKPWKQKWKPPGSLGARETENEEDGEAKTPDELRQDWDLRDLLSTQNRNAFFMVGKPDCPLGEGSIGSAEPPPLIYDMGEEWPEFKDIALASSDLWGDIVGATGAMLFLETALRLCGAHLFGKHPGECKIVPATFFNKTQLFRGSLHQLVAEVLGIASALQTGAVQQQSAGSAGRPTRSCYLVVAQRSSRWPSRSESCSLRERVQTKCHFQSAPGGAGAVAGVGGCRRKMLFWSQLPGGHTKFRALDWVTSALRSFAMAERLSFRAPQAEHLGRLEREAMPACEQVALFIDLALFVGLHGAAGVNMLWMPRESAFVEVRFAPDMRTRASQMGFFSDITTLGGRLFLQYTNVLEAGISTGLFPEVIIMDVRDLVSLLQVLSEEWLTPRLPNPSSRAKRRPFDGIFAGIWLGGGGTMIHIMSSEGYSEVQRLHARNGWVVPGYQAPPRPVPQPEIKPADGRLPLDDHLAFEVRDIRTTRRRLRALGIECFNVKDEMQNHLWIQDPDGRIIELTIESPMPAFAEDTPPTPASRL